MSLTTLADLVFAAGVVVAAVALAVAALRRGPTWLLTSIVGLEGAGAIGIWIAFALRHGRPLAVAAGGLTGCLVAATAAVLLRGALQRVAAMDERLLEAQSNLLGLVEREKATRAQELELTLARARADSRSLLEEQERQLAEERRAVEERRGGEAIAALTTRLAQVQAQVEERLASWAQDLDRAAETTKKQIADLRRRQEQLLSEVEQRLVADTERLTAEREEQRTALSRLRSDVDRALGGRGPLRRAPPRAQPARGAADAARAGAHRAGAARGGRGRPADPRHVRERRGAPGRAARPRRRARRLLVRDGGSPAVRGRRQVIAGGLGETARAGARPVGEHLRARGGDRPRREARPHRRRRRATARAPDRRRR